MTRPFKFKQFSVQQEHSAMKIGTDGVLLGAWVSLKLQPSSILDLGAGTGIISLMMAQRSQANLIDAVEIEVAAFEECTHNFEASPWSDRLFCYHASVQEFAAEFEESYDLIVSNPPFYSENVKSQEISRDVARFNDALPFEHLTVCAAKLLSSQGVFAVIIPKKEEGRFTALASSSGLFPKRICHVQGKSNTPIKRSMMEFTFVKGPVDTTSLTIENSRLDYTLEYRELVQDFYLKM